MNTTIRNLVIAAPLATAAFMMVPAAAMATEPGPVIVMPPAEPQPDIDDIAPAPKPEKPKGPSDIAPAPKPDKPKGPSDIAPAPKPEKPKGPGDITNPEPEPTQPTGPGDLTNPEPCPTHGVDCTPDGGSGSGDDDSDQDETDPDPVDGSADPADDAVDTIAVPTRVDAGLAADGQDDGGMNLSWLLAGGAVVSASGAAFAARKWARSA
ncbi:hypothetical protein [Aeromicrobium stalagmiti]|uniref:hypothetical protein n=1 Tax=Aeromicrobium stalagmiti TaxID=2738988 RepID=UPI001568553D|nr:hypothetical protein [Aeromicrobium stalagmiti]NRQ50529.1 hypothetical protein [Aeromicrobium stalagmiti]